MTWTQPICAACWYQKEGLRTPTQLNLAYRISENCSYCNNNTIAGIYVRDDPKTVPYPQKEDRD